MKLYELANEYQLIFARLDKADGDERQLLKEELDKLQLPLENKAVNVAKYIHCLRADQMAIDAEIERLEGLRKRLRSKETDMFHYLESNMRRCGIDKIESELFNIGFRQNPCKVEVMDESLIPNEYMNTKTVTTVNKTKIKDELKNGVVIPGVKLINDQTLIIK